MFVFSLLTMVLGEGTLSSKTSTSGRGDGRLKVEIVRAVRGLFAMEEGSSCLVFIISWCTPFLVSKPHSELTDGRWGEFCHSSGNPLLNLWEDRRELAADNLTKPFTIYLIRAVSFQIVEEGGVGRERM